jgi:site-specific recombinase XerD
VAKLLSGSRNGGAAVVPALVAAAGERASMRFLEFFAANIRNPHTRRAYYRAAEEFLAWCASIGVSSIAAVQPVHVATWIEESTRELAAPSVKQRLAALRHYSTGWSTARSCRSTQPNGARAAPYRDDRADAGARSGRSAGAAGQHRHVGASRPARPRLDRADGLFVRPDRRGARHGGRGCLHAEPRLWVQLREKGGKRHAMPCHNLDEYLVAYLDGACLRDDPKGPLFRTIGRGTSQLTHTALPQANAYAMIRGPAAAAGIETKLGNHSFRATGITAYLKNGGTLEKAAAMANHASTRTTQL